MEKMDCTEEAENKYKLAQEANPNDIVIHSFMTDSFDLEYNVHYENICNGITKIMGELQPIAFLMSATLVLAGIFSKDVYLQIYEIPALVASYWFLFTYIGFFSYKLTKFNAFLKIGIFSGIMAFLNITSAVLGLNYIIPQAVSGINNIIPLLPKEIQHIFQKIINNMFPPPNKTGLDIFNIFNQIACYFILSVFLLLATHFIYEKYLEPYMESWGKRL